MVALLGSGKQERENLLSGDEYGNRVSVSGGVELGRGVDVVIRFRDCSLGMTIATTLSWTLKELRWLMEGRRVLAGMDRHPSRLNGLLHHQKHGGRVILLTLNSTDISTYIRQEDGSVDTQSLRFGLSSEQTVCDV